MKLPIILFFIFFAFFLNGQPNYSAVELSKENFNIPYSIKNDLPYLVHQPLAIPLKEIEPFLAFSMSTVIKEEQIFSPEVRFSKDGKAFGEWLKVPKARHTDGRKDFFASELLFVEKENRYFQIRFKAEKTLSPKKIKLHFYSPDNTPINHKPTANPSYSKTACTCPMPVFQSRANWCPSGNCPPNPNPTTTAPTHIIIHHSAGTNVSNNWAAVVRSIWSLHVNTNGWSDIGYNWLVDPNGVLYEGRGDNILGAHFCGTNGQTAGICVMGNYELITPSTAARSKLIEFLAWKTCDIGVSPLSTASHSSSNQTLYNIAGHQEGCATACPGSLFYPTFPSLRVAVDSFAQSSCSTSGSNITAPTNLVGNVLSSSSVSIQWQDNSTNENTFLIERSALLATNFQVVAAVPADSTSFTDTGLMAQTSYFYRVRAANATDTSDYSNDLFLGTSPVSTFSTNLEKSIRVFPNPLEERLTITIDDLAIDDLMIRLIDVTGKVILEKWQKNKKEMVFDVSELVSGVYFVQVVLDEEFWVFKVIKE